MIDTTNGIDIRTLTMMTIGEIPEHHNKFKVLKGGLENGKNNNK